MAGEDRHHGRVDKMEQQVQCRGEMTGDKSRTIDEEAIEKTRISKTVDQWQLPTPSQSTSQALSTHTFYPRIDNDASGCRKKRSGEKYPCAVTSEKWRQIYKEKEDAKERERIMRNASNGKSVRRSEN